MRTHVMYSSTRTHTPDCLQAARPTLAACQAAASQVASPQSIIQHMRIIARCLAFRQLLARALVAEGLQVLPEAIQGMAAAAGATQSRMQMHVCDLVALPRPDSGVDELLCDVRPPWSTAAMLSTAFAIVIAPTVGPTPVASESETS